MPPLTRAERDALLGKAGILCRVATVTPEGAPHVTPVWFIREEDDILVTPRANSSWLANLRHNPRIALTIDDQRHPYPKVTIEGTVRMVYDLGLDEEWRDVYRRIARRYVPAEGAERYIQGTIDQPRALLAVPLGGSRVRSWRMPVEGEPFTGIWHARYYAPGSKMANRAGPEE